MSLLRSSESQLNDIRKEINVDPAPISIDGSSKVSLTLIDNFFGFEVIIKIITKFFFCFD